MSSTKCTVVCAFHRLLLSAAMTSVASAAPNDVGDDRGYIIAGPKEEMRIKKFKHGQVLISFHQKGTVFSENPTSPWYGATFFAQGSIVKDAEGKVIQEVALCETTDAGPESGKGSPGVESHGVVCEKELMIISCSNRKCTGTSTKQNLASCNRFSVLLDFSAAGTVMCQLSQRRRI